MLYIYMFIHYEAAPNIVANATARPPTAAPGREPQTIPIQPEKGQ